MGDQLSEETGEEITKLTLLEAKEDDPMTHTINQFAQLVANLLEIEDPVEGKPATVMMLLPISQECAIEISCRKVYQEAETQH